MKKAIATLSIIISMFVLGLFVVAPKHSEASFWDNLSVSFGIDIGGDSGYDNYGGYDDCDYYNDCGYSDYGYNDYSNSYDDCDYYNDCGYDYDNQGSYNYCDYNTCFCGYGCGSSSQAYNNYNSYPSYGNYNAYSQYNALYYGYMQPQYNPNSYSQPVCMTRSC